jgi:hypothetical protein
MRSAPEFARRWRGLAANLALSLASIALSLLAVEVFSRAISPHTVPAPVSDGTVVRWGRVFHESPTGKRLIPDSHVVIHNQVGEHRRVELRINEIGFRDDPLMIPKPANETRILALGDSITFAGHLPAKLSYVERLQVHLNRNANDRRFEVINAGIGDIGLENEVNLLETPGLRVEPDVVLIGFYLNDSRPGWGFPNELTNPGWLRRHSVLADTVYRRFKLHRWIEKQGESRFAWTGAVDQIAWRDDRDAFLEFAEMAKYDWGAAWREENWSIIDREFARVQEMSVKHGFEVLLVAFPVVYQMRAEFVEDAPQRTLRAKAAQLGWDFVDLLPRFRELEAVALRSGEDRSILVDACHPTAATYDEVGRLLARHLEQNLLAKHR